MRKNYLLFFLLIFIVTVTKAQVKVQNLLCENRTNPTGLDVQQPRFSWQLVSEQRNVSQTAYEIIVSSGKTTVWKSGKVMSDRSVHVPYAGTALQSGKKYTWEVRVWDNNGKPSPLSEPAFFQTALLSVADWKAKWIEAGFEEDSINRPAQYFRKQFSAAKKIASATVYITAHGMYEAQINGKRVGDAYLTPGWTSYNKRLQYQVYDVTNMLTSGSNAIGVVTGNGWYRGFIAWSGNKDSYGKKTGLLFQLDITYSDGTTSTIVSDGSWKSSTGSIRYSEIYHGETIDAREEKAGWSTANYNDANWPGVRVQNYPNDNLLATYNEPVRKHETFKPLKIFTTPKGEKVIDFGQNLVGWVIVNANGKTGDKITIRHAEVLDKNGNFYVDNLRAAHATANYILSGRGEETFEPHFTFYGFRYIKIEGVNEIKQEDFTAVALYSDMKPTGTFTSSNALINQLQHNIQWGQRGNFLDVPTDCPQRDERLGWTGDAQAFSRTAAFNFGVNNFFAKWLRDVEADQRPSGKVPFVIPNVLQPEAGASTGWADAATIIPWNMYLAYGDKKILENQYHSMKAWVGYMEDSSKNYLWNKGFHFGDWLFYRPFDDNDGRSAVTDKYMIAQCFFTNSVQIMINTAKVLGKNDDVAKYTELLKNLKAAFVKEYLTPNGRLVSSTQTAYVLALNFDMLPEDQREQTAQKLVDNIKSYNNHLTTGFLGTPYLCHVLSRFGKTDVAFTLLMQESYPSWLYPVKMGATTIWERWNGIRPDSTFEPASMNSFNHYAYGAIGDWMYRVVAGLDTYDDAPGYKHIKIKPHVGGGLTNASVILETYYGRVISGWKIEGDKFVSIIEVPANTTATVFLPVSNADLITENGSPLSKDIQVVKGEDGKVVLKLGSGKYHLEMPK
ncbi:MAG TPA: family 78 glycoside hydrolase catalytic domain [Chitinophagaceae bacterium]|jgi:alpha-L-rhamnosidase|nr:family 78 glycoside hydrolase catalytic domain [Chitinophagaceae bacterium]